MTDLQVLSRVRYGKDPTDNYAVYGSYDFPIWTPRLRLNLFAACSQFDTFPPCRGWISSGTALLTVAF